MIKKFLSRFWPLIFITSIWFVFSASYFLQHKVPYPSKYQVTHFTPWNEYPQYWGPVKNSAMPDVVDQIYPWKHFTIESLKQGQIPLWNPYSFAGTPHLANYQSAVLSPFNFLFFIFPFVDAWSLVILLQPLLAGLFLYLFLRIVKVSALGSLIGSVSFMFCGFVTVWMAYGTMGMVAAFLPLSLFAIEKIFKKISIGSFLLLPLSLVVSFFSGHFQIAFYAACFSFAYLLFKCFDSKNIKISLWALGAYALGVCISLFQILPTLELYRLAVRSELFFNTGAIPLYYIVTVFAPDFFGNPVTLNVFANQQYAEWASFVGIIPLTLVAAALFSKRNKTILFFFVMALVSLTLALDTPLQNYLALLKLPIFSTSIPSRIIILFSFSLAVLAGFGLDSLMELLRKKQKNKIFIILFIIGSILFISWALVTAMHLLPPERAAIAKRNLLLPSLFFFLTTISLLVILFVKKKFFIIGFLLLALTTIDSFRFAHKWMPFDDARLVFPESPVIKVMQKNIGEGRVFGNFGAFIDTYYHLPSIEGYDPLYSKRYGEFIQSANTGELTPAIRSEVILNRRGKYSQRVLDFLGVTLIYQPISYTNQSWGYPLWEHPENFPTIFRDDRLQVVKNKTAMPRVKLFYDYEIVADKKKLIKRFYSDAFDYRNVLLLEEDPGLTKNQEVGIKNQVSITSYASNKISIAVFTAEPAMLFLSDSYYPRWKVRVNDKEEKIFVADYTFRAVRVPAGKSTVVFCYSGLF